MARIDPRNSTQYWWDRHLSGLSLLCADFTTHEYPPHTHEALVVAVTEQGGSVVRSRGQIEEAKPSTLFVFNKRPHPNATRVFVNWLLTHDVQEGFAKAIQQSSRRADVASVAEPDQTPIPGVTYLHTQWEEDQQKMDDAVKLVGEWHKQVK